MWESADSVLVQLALPPAFEAEADEHAVHPALLDVATGVLGGRTDDGFFAPFTYSTLTWYRPLPSRGYGHVRVRHRAADSLTLDADLVAPDGRLVLSIAGLTTRRIGADDFVGNRAAGTAAPPSGIGSTDAVRYLFELLGARTPPQVAILPPGPNVQAQSTAGHAAVLHAAGSAKPADGAAATAEAIQSKLAGLWCTVLGRPDVETGSDFFDLGGDSLVAVALTARIRDTFGVELSVGALFDYPTLAGLADLVLANLHGPEPRRRSTDQ